MLGFCSVISSLRCFGHDPRDRTLMNSAADRSALSGPLSHCAAAPYPLVGSDRIGSDRIGSDRIVKLPKALVSVALTAALGSPCYRHELATVRERHRREAASLTCDTVTLQRSTYVQGHSGHSLWPIGALASRVGLQAGAPGVLCRQDDGRPAAHVHRAGLPRFALLCLHVAAAVREGVLRGM